MVSKRGRQSTAELSIVPIDGRRKPIDPPPELSAIEAAIFRELVGACDPTHFRVSDRPLLSALCTAIHLSRFYAGEIGEDPTAFKSYTEATKLVISLSTKLRLTPSSRITPRTAGRHEPRQGSAPWER
jgi:phage terminase small subunit